MTGEVSMAKIYRDNYCSVYLSSGIGKFCTGAPRVCKVEIIGKFVLRLRGKFWTETTTKILRLRLSGKFWTETTKKILDSN